MQQKNPRETKQKLARVCGEVIISRERYLHSLIQLEGGKMTMFITFAATEQSPQSLHYYLH
jgi:hypothetical protein